MKNALLLISSTLLFQIALSAGASERNVPCSALPAAVQAQGKSMLNGASVRSCVKDSSRSGTTYEMELVKDGRSRDISFDADGRVLEIEAQVDVEELPEAVKQAMRTASHGGKLGKIESLTKDGKIVSYETVITRDGKRKEIAFQPDGTSMKPD